MEENVIQLKVSDASTMLEEKRYREAIETLHNSTTPESPAEHFALLALANFHIEQYDAAVKYFETALALEPENTDWKDLLQHARGNLLSEVNEPIPEVYYFDKDKLLSKPVVPQGALPPEPPPPPKASL